MFSGWQRQRNCRLARGLMLDQTSSSRRTCSSARFIVHSASIDLIWICKKSLLELLFHLPHLSVVSTSLTTLSWWVSRKMLNKVRVNNCFENPKHPYNHWHCCPSNAQLRQKNAVRVNQAEGELPSPLNPPSGCAFFTDVHVMQMTAAEHETQVNWRLDSEKRPTNKATWLPLPCG